MCLFTKLIKNRKYTANTKNGGIIPPLPIIIKDGIEYRDHRVGTVPKKCGKCIECMKQKARDWAIRLKEEIKYDWYEITVVKGNKQKGNITVEKIKKRREKPRWVTLTFSNESIQKLSTRTNTKGYEFDNEMARIGLDLFQNRWKKKYKETPRHWFVTELGHSGTENIHLHGFIFTDKTPAEIEERWGYGYVYHGYSVNNAAINYTIKYVHKQDSDHKYYVPIILSSKGIGSQYLKSYDAKKHNEKNDTYTNEKGYKQKLPDYYRNHIYNEEQKEKMWIEKLNKNEIYVLGQKVNIKNGLDDFRNVLTEARAINKSMGYGDAEIDYDQ